MFLLYSSMVLDNASSKVRDCMLPRLWDLPFLKLMILYIRLILGPNQSSSAMLVRYFIIIFVILIWKIEVRSLTLQEVCNLILLCNWPLLFVLSDEPPIQRAFVL